MAGCGVVDGVEAGGADACGGFGGAFGAAAFVGGEVDDEVVEVGEEFVGGQVDVGEGAYGGADAAHGGGGADAVADDVADDEGDAGAGEGMTSNQSPPTPALLPAGR
ncbi:hypothetical protein SAV14893_095070 [Streptomyces avermitilis]|uniref:Uncharacterized protein n=1 Tax=Streptomyces avermitilis TaxID=33903 RepID=A0A4D4ME84_STRAX|nr:hypothetical protein SAV14893_095070 [Streptomyces avermitilis]